MWKLHFQRRCLVPSAFVVHKYSNLERNPSDYIRFIVLLSSDNSHHYISDNNTYVKDKRVQNGFSLMKSVFLFLKELFDGFIGERKIHMFMFMYAQSYIYNAQSYIYNLLIYLSRWWCHELSIVVSSFYLRCIDLRFFCFFYKSKFLCHSWSPRNPNIFWSSGGCSRQPNWSCMHNPTYIIY